MSIWGVANGLVNEIDAWISLRRGKDVRLHYSKKSLLQLTKLAVWRDRHKLSVSDMLDMLMPVLIAQTKKRELVGLGITVPTLTGSGAERILEKEIQKRYPEGEHIKIWIEQERDRQLRAEEIDQLDGLTPREKVVQSGRIEDYIDEYRNRILRKRHASRVAADSKCRKRKAYRNNPWR